ncbi:APC family permease [Actinophytocola oryzae]|uniref:Amino acid transporter n=1 Tax=Actinophytocola oryzae TaxID=502181 RepID=A0A4R7V8V5_9PSEU|nr:APC family permease [Actinophytocola oryzae]TDV45340.1 amino acid transporter [Actinophytocola oryzae]
MSAARQSARPSNVATALAADRLGVPAVVFFVMSAATPLTVVAGVVTTGYAVTGITGLPIAFVVIGAVLALFCVGYVSMAHRVANAGAFYAYISQGIGRPVGVAGAWVALVAYNALQVGLYGAIGAATTPLLSAWFGLDVAWWVVALIAWAIVAVLGQLHVDVNGRVLAVLLVAEVAVIVVYSLANIANPAGGTITFDTLDPTALFAPGVGAILALGVLGFVGFEGAVVYSEEARDPQRTIRIASYVAVGVIAGLYTLGSWAMSVATGPDQIVAQSQASSTELIFQLAGTHLGVLIVDIGRVLFVTSVLAAMISFHNTTARYVFALGREGVLPVVLGRTSPRTGSPWLGSVIQSVVGLVVIVLYAVAGWDPVVQLFFWGGTAGGLGVLFLIVTTSVAIVVYFLRQPAGETVWRRLVAPVLAAVLLLIVVVLALVNFATLLGVDPTSPLRWGIPLAYLVIAVLGVVWALALRYRRRTVYAAIGLGAKSATATRAADDAADVPAKPDFDWTEDSR